MKHFKSLFNYEFVIYISIFIVFNFIQIQIYTTIFIGIIVFNIELVRPKLLVKFNTSQCVRNFLIFGLNLQYQCIFWKSFQSFDNLLTVTFWMKILNKILCTYYCPKVLRIRHKTWVLPSETALAYHRIYIENHFS